MPSLSILFSNEDDRPGAQSVGAPSCFGDLNLDQVTDAVTSKWGDYDLKPFFYAPLSRVDAIRYRHEVFQDLEDARLYDYVLSFAKAMRTMREHLPKPDSRHYRHQKEAWFLHGVEIYCNAVKRFVADLGTTQFKSRGFLALRQYLANYTAGPSFNALVEETNTLISDLAKVRYSVLINGDSFTVRDYESEADYSAEVEETFDKFKQGAVKDYRVTYRLDLGLNHIEAKILEFVARLNPDLFSRLDDYWVRHSDFIDRVISTFDREIHFYVSYLDHVAKFKRVGLQFCYPRMSDTSKALCNDEGFDLALAQKLTDANKPIVCNDLFLEGKERIIVVSGPNQGGKTTFARTFGQLHYLASIGCPVPGREAQLFLYDQLFTHFEREEKVESLRGKLEDDLVRVHAILERATSRSVVVMNEIFTSTTLQDEVFLSKRIMEKIVALDLPCIWVTFVDELASFSEQTVSMVSTIVPENPALRTFKIVRRPADGLAYAMALAEKYGLTHQRVKERIAS